MKMLQKSQEVIRVETCGNVITVQAAVPIHVYMHIRRIRFTYAMALRGSCEHAYKDFSDLSFLLGSYDIALSISI